MTPIEQAKRIRKQLDLIVTEMSDEKAIENSVLFKIWNGKGVYYNAGERILYNDVLYLVLLSHTSQLDWTPETAHSLYARVLIPDPEKVDPWKRPDAGTNGYMKGDKVLWNDVVKESTIDYNHYSPDEYPLGWKDVE